VTDVWLMYATFARVEKQTLPPYYRPCSLAKASTSFGKLASKKSSDNLHHGNVGEEPGSTDESRKAGGNGHDSSNRIRGNVREII